MNVRSLPAGLLATAALAASVTAGPALAPGAEDEDALVAAGKTKLAGLALEIVPSKERYEQGEPIEVAMRYTYARKRGLRVQVVTYDRSGRIRDFWFTAEDEKGEPVRDPIKGCTGGFGGGLRGGQSLGPAEPYEQKVVVNEWLCFDRPGRYRVTAHSKIVSFDYDGIGGGGPSIPLESEPVEIEIVPFDEARRAGRIGALAEVLEGDDRSARERAMQELRFMVDERAIPLLVKGLEDEFGNVVVQTGFGLLSFLDPEPVTAEILAAVERRERPLAPGLISRYSHYLAAIGARAAAEGGEVDWRLRTEMYKRWQKRLAEGFEERLDGLPPGRAAETTLDGLREGLLSRSDLRNWKLVLDNAEAMSEEHQRRAGYLVESHCRQRVLAPELARIVANTQLVPELRSAAAIALGAMGDDSARDAVFEDLVSEKPVMWSGAHAALGDYRKREVGEALLRLVDSGGLKTRQSAARRLRDFGEALSADELRGLMQRRSADNAYVREALLEALALASPAYAVPFIRDVLHDPTMVNCGLSGVAVRVVGRIDSPAAQELTLEMLRSDEVEYRSGMASALGDSWGQAEQAKRFAATGPPSRHFKRLMPPAADLATAFVSELLALYRADPSGSVRQAAKNALVRITGIPREGLWESTTGQADACIPRWETWLRENAARYGRWGRAQCGVALKCSTDKGVYEVGEKIGVTCRSRRVSEGGGDLETVRLYGRVYEPGRPPEGHGETFQRDLLARALARRVERPLPGDEIGSEAAYHVELHDIPGRDVPGPGIPGHGDLGRPCSVRFRLQYFFRDGARAAGRGAVQSHPVVLHIRPAPDEPAPDGTRISPRLPGP